MGGVVGKKKTGETVHPESEQAGRTTKEEKSNNKKRKQFNTLPETSNFEKAELDNFHLKVIPKDDEAKGLLTTTLKSHLLFSTLDSDTIVSIVGAMELVEVMTGDVLITQGDTGEGAMSFYIVQTGHFDIEVSGQGVVATAGPFGSFGELSIVFRQPRSATVRATEESVCWSLDRTTFRKFLAASSNQQLHDISEALRSIPLLQGLTETHVTKLATCTAIEKYKDKMTIITKGEIGEKFYIIKDGAVVCTDIVNPTTGQPVNDVKLSQGAHFGERALIQLEPRAATVVADGECELLVVRRDDFDNLLGSLADMLGRTLAKNALRAMPALSGLAEGALERIEMRLEGTAPEDVKPNEPIVRKGEPVDALFVVGAGTVRISGDDGLNAKGDEQPADGDGRLLGGGSYFCEGGLAHLGIPGVGELPEKPPSASSIKPEDGTMLPLFDATVVGEGCKVFRVPYALVKESHKAAADEAADRAEQRAIEAACPRLNELTNRQTLGVGAFGRVKLVTHYAKPDAPKMRRFSARKMEKGEKEEDGELQCYALKILSKAHIVGSKQADSTIRERDILRALKHPFILRLHTTYQTAHACYFLLELVPGGELFGRLAKMPAGQISDSEARFYAECTIEALQHMHSRDIVYRDLKPENLLIDAKGYIKVVDFGFAKKVLTGITHTVCLTPEYVSPEMALGKGYFKDVDYWAFGVLVYEMVVGYTPFSGGGADVNLMSVFRAIVAGKVDYPPVMQPLTKDLVMQLLRRQVSKRLGNLKGGADDIKAHQWFGSVDWSVLTQLKVPTPWTPPINNALDLSNFDAYDEDEDMPEYHGDQSIFDGF